MHRQANRRLILLVVALGLLPLACSPTTDGPAAAVETFYRHLNEGNYAEAMSLYGEDALRVIEDPNQVGHSGFAQWAESETKSSTISKVEILDTTTEDEKASVDFEIEYADGSSVRRSVDLTREADQWKLGLVL